MDSPKCPECFKTGKLAQTYRMVGSHNYQCHDCKKVFNHSEFKEIDFEWKTKPQEYLAYMKEKKKDGKPRKQTA